MIAQLCALLLATPLAPWNAGINAEPAFQVQAIDRDTYIIRQSVKTNFEAPFLYLLFGKNRALLLDSGAGNVDPTPVINKIITEWATRNNRAPPPLTVAHSHSHGDHHQGDALLAARPNTSVIGLSPTEVASAFGVTNWPTDFGHIDLGGRRLTIIPTPGHEPAHIMVLDQKSNLLFTGDSLYPGRLYVPANKFAAFRASIDRVVAATKTNPPQTLYGAHIEMRRTAGIDYEQRATVHHDEHALPLPYAALLELQAALHAMPEEPVRQTRDDFIIVPVAPN